MAAAVEATSGHYSNFTGDGLMALFGLEQSDDAASLPSAEPQVRQAHVPESLSCCFFCTSQLRPHFCLFLSSDHCLPRRSSAKAGPLFFAIGR